MNRDIEFSLYCDEDKLQKMRRLLEKLSLSYLFLKLIQKHAFAKYSVNQIYALLYE